MTQWDVVVVGGANYDYLVRGSHLPTPGDTVNGNEFQEAPGGKGANQAVAAARLGAKVALLARIGKDTRGDTLMARFAAEGVDTSHVLRDADAATGIALVHVTESGEKQIFVAPGANDQLTAADIADAAPLFANARVLLTQLEIPQESVMAALQQAKNAGLQTILDPAPPRALPDKLLRLVDLIKPNSAEAKSITGIQVSDQNAAHKAAQALLDKGIKTVAVQAGEAGNLLVWGEDERWLPRIEVDSVDATGAGDAFAAALAVALAEGRPLTEAGPFASAAAALTTTNVGAQAALPKRQTVLDLVEQSRVTA
ncbi:MAG: ribokinase [Caldilineaceae bacterium]|nr:ribokinase [Caldilineaceae bacterium]